MDKAERRKMITDRLVAEATPSGKEITRAMLEELFEAADRLESIDLSLGQLLEIEHDKRNR